MLVLGIILLCGLIVLYFMPTSRTDAEQFKEEYESLNGTIREKDGKTIRSISISRTNPMIYSDEEEIIEKIHNKDTFLIYFGFPDCPWCRSVLPNLLRACDDLGLDAIYYVNVKDIRDTIEIQEDGSLDTTINGSDGYYQLLELLGDILDDYTLKDSNGKEISTGEKRIYAPNVVAIVSGKAIQLEDGISSLQTDGYMKLTDEMNEESYQKFRCIVNCVLDVKEVCSNDSKC